MRFPVVLHTDNGKHYGVTVPDLSGCFSAGDSIDEALSSVQEAIDLHLEGLVEEGKEVPAVKCIDIHQANPDYADGLWALVEVDTSRFDGKAEKINITVPRRILAQIDAFARSHSLSRSRFLVDAAQRAMAAS